MNSYEVVGKSVIRNDGADKILGRAQSVSYTHLTLPTTPYV